MKQKWWPIIFLVAMAGCAGEVKTNEELAMESVQSDSTAAVPAISDEAIADILNSIPSPLEISTMIKESGGEYSTTILNNYENSKNYNSSYKKAINLGIYSTDLGYINIYGQSKDALTYLSSVKDLADGLNIGHFFDMGTIKRLALNSSNVDSLLIITTGNFEKINQFLQKNKRSEQSVLMLAGGWIEALHISCKVYNQNKNTALREKIGEQKIILDQLMLLLGNYPDDPNIKALQDNFKKLQSVYNTIEITYVYKESKMKEVDGMLVIEDESESKINVTDEHVKSITEITENIRKDIIL
jgi:hypothetical protein